MVPVFFPPATRQHCRRQLGQLRKEKAREEDTSAFSARLRAVTVFESVISSLSVYGILCRLLIQCDIYVTLHILPIFQRLHGNGDGCSALIILQHVG